MSQQIINKIKIITDSCSDLPMRLARERDICIVPLTVTFGPRHFTEHVDIDSKLFFKLLVENKAHFPKTSQPNPEAFLKAFRDAEIDGYTDIICINVTSKSSGTYNSASVARTLALEDPDIKANIHVFDSLNASLAVGELVLAADNMAKSGMTAAQVLEQLELLRTRMAIYFILDTLEFVRKGGRIGNIRAVLGELMHIKPVLTFFKGVPVDVSKVRGFLQAKDELIRIFKAKALTMEKVTIIHAASSDRAKQLSAELEKMIKNIKISIYEVGAVMGTYTGPGAIGLVFEEKKPRWSEG